MENDIIKNVIACKMFLASLSININDYDTVVGWFKELCSLLTLLLNCTTSYLKNSKMKRDRNVLQTMLLYLKQIITLLSLLIKVFLKENDVQEIITEARYCVLKQLTLCLDGIKSFMSDCNIKETNSGSFLWWMDLSLDKLTEIDPSCGKAVSLSKYKEARRLIEEVLCNAMSIAQVAFTDESKIIKGSSKSVLDALDALLLELDKVTANIAMCNLSIDSCYDKLCALERKVNTAVLKLSLRVFSEYTMLLEKLHHYCVTGRVKYDEEKLDNMIADFDLHVDRIMQIGLFAIASSSDTSCSIKMKSCLASLEALEGELVPSFNALVLDKSIHNINFALLLKHHWIQQAESLRHLIYSIIDPFAFCQVTYEELKQTIEDAEQNMRNNDGILERNVLRPICNESHILTDVVIESIKDMTSNNVAKVKGVTKDIKHVLHEIKMAGQILLVDRAADKQGSARVLKRCKILLTLIKKLLLILSEETNAPTIQIPEQQDIATGAINGSHEAKDENKFLNHIINRGKEMLKDRNVLYKTPTKTGKNTSRILEASKLLSIKFSATNTNKPLPLSKFVHLRNLQFSYSRVRNDSSVDLQITEILNDLENLSTSFK